MPGLLGKVVVTVQNKSVHVFINPTSVPETTRAFLLPFIFVDPQRPSRWGWDCWDREESWLWMWSEFVLEGPINKKATDQSRCIVGQREKCSCMCERTG